MGMNESEVREFRAWHKATMTKNGYPPEIVCELSTARERFFPKQWRELVEGAYRKPKF